MDKEIVPSITITIDEGRLKSYDTQAVLINAMLVDADFDIIVDEEGNILTE